MSTIRSEGQPERFGMCEMPYDCRTDPGLPTQRPLTSVNTSQEMRPTVCPGNSDFTHQREQGHSGNLQHPMSRQGSSGVEDARGRRKRSLDDQQSSPLARKRNRTSITDPLDGIGRQRITTQVESVLSNILEMDGSNWIESNTNRDRPIGNRRPTWSQEDKNFLSVCARRGAYRTAANTIRYKPNEVLRLFSPSEGRNDSDPGTERSANGLMAKWRKISHLYLPIDVSTLPPYRKGPKAAWNEDELEVVEEIAKLKIKGRIPNDDVSVKVFRTMLTQSTKSWSSIRARLDVITREMRSAAQTSAEMQSTLNTQQSSSKRNWEASDSQTEVARKRRRQYMPSQNPDSEQEDTLNGIYNTESSQAIDAGTELANTEIGRLSEENVGENPAHSQSGGGNKVDKRERFRDRGPRQGNSERFPREQPPQQVTIPEKVNDKFKHYLKYIEGATRKKLPTLSYPPTKGEIAIIDKLIENENPNSLEEVSHTLYCAALAVIDQRERPTITSELNKTKNYIKTLSGRLKAARQRLGQAQAAINRMVKNDLEVITYHRPDDGQITRTKRWYEVRKTQKLEAVRALTHSIKIANAKVDGLQEKCRQVTQSEPAEEQPHKLKMPTVEKYFKTLLEHEVAFDKDDPAIKQWFSKRNETVEKEHEDISQSTWNDCIKKIKPWKAPGPDGIQAFYWKSVPVAKGRLLEAANQYLKAQTTPEWLCKGRTVLIYKGKGAEEQPANYRPITCLNTAYKLITAAVCKTIHPYIEAHWNHQQRAMSKGMQGTSHALLTDRIIQEYHQAKNQPLSVAWFDYKKAFDSTPHKLILDCLKVVGAPKNIQTWLKNTMSNWKTVFQLRRGKKTVDSGPITFRRGVYQGDSLSPLLFCLSLIPLQDILDKETEGITLISNTDRVKITHQLYMDDLKIYAASDAALDKAICKVNEVSHKTGMSLGINKCAQDHFKGPANGLETNKLIPRLGKEESYTYLGVKQQVLNMDRVNIVELTEDICTKAKNIFSNGQPWRKQVQTFNWQIPSKARYLVMSSYAGLCATEDGSCRFNNLDGKIRGILVASGHRQKTCSKERLYLQAKDGGLHIKSLKDTYYESTIARKLYCESNTGDITRLVNIAKANELAIKFIQAQDQHYEGIGRITALQITVGSAHSKADEKLIKKAHRKHITDQRWARVDMLHQAATLYRERNRHVLPSIGNMFLKGFIQKHQLKGIVAAQELQALILTHASRHNMNPACPYCTTPLKNPLYELKHVLGSCPQNRGLINHRHDGVAIQVHHMLERYAMSNGKAEIRFDVFPQPIIKNGDYVLKWDHLYGGMPINSHRRPDIVLEDNRNKRIFIFEIGVCTFESLQMRTEGKHNRYKVGYDTFDHEKDQQSRASLADSLSKDCKYTVEVIPIIVGYWGEQLPKKDRLNWHLLEKLVGKKQADMLSLKISCQAAIQSEKILSKYLSCLPAANN